MNYFRTGTVAITRYLRAGHAILQTGMAFPGPDFFLEHFSIDACLDIEPVT
jgi:hypothetical protein